MSESSIILEKFRRAGGRFLIDDEKFYDKASGIEAIVLDWDGVFNNGWKSNNDFQSGFSEVDSMGINLLRFAIWMKKKIIAPVAIITGQKNTSAKYFANRENYNYIFSGFKNKIEAYEIFLNKTYLSPLKVAFFFDDILDFAIAEHSNLKPAIKIFISRPANPLLNEYAEKHQLYDYRTAFSCDSFAIREACELITSMIYDFEKLIELRINYYNGYSSFITNRLRIKTISVDFS